MRRGRAYAALGALALAGCAQPGAEAPAASAPALNAPALNAPGLVVAQEDRAIRVTGPAANEDALAAHHCAAAKRARAVNAEALSWAGGVAKRNTNGDGVAADLVYEMEAASMVRATDAPPAESRAALVADWLIYCDEAGIPREGEA